MHQKPILAVETQFLKSVRLVPTLIPILRNFSRFRYKRNGGKYWKGFVFSKGVEWEKMNLDWYRSFSEENRLVIFYDQLVANTLEVMQKIADFLDVPTSEKTWTCVMNHKEGIYKRSKKKLGIEVFSHKMRDFLEQKKVFVYHMLGRNITNRFQ